MDNNKLGNDIILLDLLREKCFNLFMEDNNIFKGQYTKAIHMASAGFKIGLDLDLKLVWEEYLTMIRNFTMWLVKYMKKLPGFDKIRADDLVTILNQRLFVVLGFIVSKLFIREELYMLINDRIHLSRYWCDKIFGDLLSKKIFYYHSKLNEFELTESEICILIPYILSFDGKTFFLFFTIHN